MASDETISKCYINSLSSSLLGYIFSFMSVNERVCIDEVCKHWRDVNIKYQWINKLQSLKFLNQNTSFNSFVKILKRYGENLVCLEVVDFASPSFPSDWLEFIAKLCPKLESLSFPISRLDKANPCIPPETLHLLSEHCTQLKQLNLKRRQFTDEGVTSLFRNCQLQAINFTFNQSLNGECFKIISDSIQCIMLHGCWSLTCGLENIRMCRNLHYLDISNCTSLNSSTVTRVLQSIGGSLTELFMGKNPQLNTEAVWCVPSHCKKLKLLNLFSLNQVRNTFVEAVAKSCTHLQTLSVNKTPIDDKSLFVMRSMIFLTNLSVAATQITDVGLFVLSQTGLLEKLVISYCTQIGDPGCIAVIRCCKNLSKLDVSYCIKVTDATIDDAMQVRTLNQGKLVIFARKTNIQNAMKASIMEVHI